MDFRRRPLRDAAIGALAGLAGAYVMQHAAKVIPEGVLPPRGPWGGGGRPPELPPATELLAKRLFEPLGVPVTGPLQRLLGQAVHYGYGAFWGVVLGEWLGSSRRPGTLRRGLLLGLALFGLGDELIVPKLGLARPAREYPPDVHLRALAAHLAYGASTAVLYRALSRGV